MAVAGNRKLSRNPGDVPGRIATVEIFGQCVGDVTGKTDGQEIRQIVGEPELKAFGVHIAEREIVCVDVRIGRGNANLPVVDGGLKITRFLVLAVPQTDQPGKAIGNAWLPRVEKCWGCRLGVKKR